jgi:H+-transporting ATPase
MTGHETLSNPPGENATRQTADVASETAGLTEAEAARQLQQYGENALAEHHVSVFERLAHFFWGPIPG